MTRRIKSALAGLTLGTVLVFRARHPEADCPLCRLVAWAGRRNAERASTARHTDDLAQQRSNTARVGRTTLHNVHSPDACSGHPCVIHNPSDHHMRDWPTNWRADRRMIERVCPHGIGHPDPDNPGDKQHGCDGCCEAAA